MHQLKVHFRSPVSTPLQKLSVRPFGIFPSHVPSLLQIGRERIWMSLQVGVWESERMHKPNGFQVLEIKLFERGTGVEKSSRLGPGSWISAVCTQPEGRTLPEKQAARREREVSGGPAVWPLLG